MVQSIFKMNTKWNSFYDSCRYQKFSMDFSRNSTGNVSRNSRWNSCRYCWWDLFSISSYLVSPWIPPEIYTEIIPGFSSGFFHNSTRNSYWHSSWYFFKKLLLGLLQYCCCYLSRQFWRKSSRFFFIILGCLWEFSRNVCRTLKSLEIENIPGEIAWKILARISGKKSCRKHWRNPSSSFWMCEAVPREILEKNFFWNHWRNS